MGRNIVHGDKMIEQEVPNSPTSFSIIAGRIILCEMEEASSQTAVCNVYRGNVDINK
jgi:hypothetical protein